VFSTIDTNIGKIAQEILFLKVMVSFLASGTAVKNVSDGKIRCLENSRQASKEDTLPVGRVSSGWCKYKAESSRYATECGRTGSSSCDGKGASRPPADISIQIPFPVFG
jgi:hypothetical protein